MLERRSLRGPVALGVVLIVLIVILAAVWVSGGVIGAMSDRSSAPAFWVILATGVVLLPGVLAGVIAYLTLTVKAFRLNQRQSNFIDSVTHELKSPIASLKLYLQTMTQREVDEAQQRDFRRIMLEDVERLDSLINHLLDAARIDRDVERSDAKPIRLDELIRQCAQATCLRYRLPGHVVHIESPHVTVINRPIQLEILFRNLIDNAVKYGGSPPEVDVHVRHVGEHQVMVTIADNGPGIPANQRRKVFGRFVRLGNELERSTPGTGLGLYLVRNVTKAIGGTIRVRDRSETLRTSQRLGGVRASTRSSNSSAKNSVSASDEIPDSQNVFASGADANPPGQQTSPVHASDRVLGSDIRDNQSESEKPDKVQAASGTLFEVTLGGVVPPVAGQC